MGQEDPPATHHHAFDILLPKAHAGRGRGLTDPDTAAREQMLADVGLVDVGSTAATEKSRPAYHSTSTLTDPEAALIPEGGSTQHFPAIALSASPAVSWTKTPASKIGLGESVLRRRPSFKTLAYDPSIPLVYLSEEEETVENNSAQSLQNARLLLQESQARNIRGVSHGSRNSAHPKLNAASHNVPNAALIETSSPTSLSNLDSSAFDTALKLQAKAKNDSHPPSNSNSLNTTLLIHSDAIFLPSAMEAKTSSALPSSDGKRTGTGSTSSRIAHIMRAVDADRHRLEVQHARMVEALREVEREKIEYRDCMAGLMHSLREHEGRLLGRIAELQDECDRRGCEVEWLREVVAGEGQAGEKVE
jgi:hypothetical protein